jgi:hypothetical protein
MGQLRAQNLQAQTAGLQLQSAKMQMNSNQALLTAMANGGGDWDKTYQLAANSGQVLPTDLFKIKQSQLDLQKEALALDTSQQAAVKGKMDIYHGLLDNVHSQDDLDAANREATRRGLFTLPGNMTSFSPLQQYDPLHLQAYQNGLLGHQAAIDQSKTIAATQESEAKAAQARAEAERAKIENIEKQKNLAVGEIRAALDPDTGTLAPKAQADIQARYPNVIIPPLNTREGARQFIASVVPEEKVPEYKIGLLRAEQGIVGTDDFQSIFLPAYAKNLGYQSVAQLPPKDRMAAFQVFKQYDTNPEMLNSILASRAMTQQMHLFTMDNALYQRGQQSYQFSTNQLNQEAKPVEALADRFARLRDSISQNTPQADALVAPELLSVMSGGAGSGLRMNEAEIARIVGGRSKWEDLKAKINKWNLDPKSATSITSEQRKEIRDLMDASEKRLNQKMGLINDARNALSTSQDPMEHRQIMTGFHQRMLGVDQPPQTAAPNAPSTIPAIPASIPQQFRSTVRYSPSQKKFYYQDANKKWQTAPAQ